MARMHGPLLLVIALALGACGDDSGSGGTENDSGSSGTTDTTTTTSTTTTTTTTTDGTGTGTTTTTTDDSTTDASATEGTGTDGTGTDGSATDGTDTDATDTDGTGGSSDVYPACEEAEPQCPPAFDQCALFGIQQNPVGSHCTIFCTEVGDCPADPNATAVPSCGGIGQQRCSLDCEGSATCPTGMECIQIVPGTERCMFSAQ